MVFRMESREAVVTGGTVEENHITTDAFGFQHTPEQVTTELAMELSCPREGVKTVRTDIEVQMA